MKRSALLLLALVGTANAGGPSATRRAAVGSVEGHAAALVGLSDQIRAVAETALRETRLSQLLADFAEVPAE